MQSIIQYTRGFILAYLAFMVSRFVYVAENWNALGDVLYNNSLWDVLCGSLIFDTSALMYLNVLYTVLMLLPLRQGSRFMLGTKYLWMFTNGLGVIANIADAAYFPFTGRRTTATVFAEFQNEDNMLLIFGSEFIKHWYLVIAAILILWAMWRLYDAPECRLRLRNIYYYPTKVLTLVLMAGLTVAGMRGGFTTAVRPITISNATQYVKRPTEAAAILNTPFSIMRTFGKGSFRDPGYFSSRQELDTVFSPIHHLATPDSIKANVKKRNIVILICESLGQEYLTRYTPFVDSLCTHSLTFRNSFANGRKSIDGMPSILSGIPMFIEPFFLTSSSLNQVGGIARYAGEMGYESAFFHGAENGSMGFQAFANATGFQRYYGRSEYGNGDFDGTWAVWDEPFLQFMAHTITSDLKEPFVSAVFTASSHHPFHIPEQYESVFPDDGTHPMHRCIRYLDHSLRQFFQTAEKQPWYDNTLFVITADHTNVTSHPEYETDLGLYRVPVIMFDPSGEVFAPQRHNAIAQQTDITPTLLGAIGYDKPYVAWGCDLLNTPDSLTWAVNYNNGIYQYVSDSLFIQSDGSQVKSAYNYVADTLLQTDISNKLPEQKLQAIHHHLQGIIQSYMQRMSQDSLVIR